jgi:ABC-type taurine transport system ATPase subunit
MDRDLRHNLRQEARCVVKKIEEKTSDKSVLKSEDVPLNWEDLVFDIDHSLQLQPPKKPKRSDVAAANSAHVRRI